MVVVVVLYHSSYPVAGDRNLASIHRHIGRNRSDSRLGTTRIVVAAAVAVEGAHSQAQVLLFWGQLDLDQNPNPEPDLGKGAGQDIHHRYMA